MEHVTVIGRDAAREAGYSGITQCAQCGGPIGELTIVEVADAYTPLSPDVLASINNELIERGLPPGVKTIEVRNVHIVGVCERCAALLPSFGGSD